jgi:drug/metabolite transporter (DMT)-like permease
MWGGHSCPAQLGTYAYVNPVVAVIFGYFFGGEAVGQRTLLGTLLVLISVITITTTRSKTRSEDPAITECNLSKRRR